MMTGLHLACWWRPYAWAAVWVAEAAIWIGLPITIEHLDGLEDHLARMAVRAVRISPRRS